MKKSFSIRKIDNLGRIVIPMDIRRALEIKDWDELRISLVDQSVLISKAVRQCTFCGNEENLSMLHGKCICDNCRRALQELK